MRRSNLESAIKICSRVIAGSYLLYISLQSSYAAGKAPYNIFVSFEKCDITQCESHAFITNSDGSSIRNCIAVWAFNAFPRKIQRSYCKNVHFKDSRLDIPIGIGTYSQTQFPSNIGNHYMGALWKVSQTDGKAEICLPSGGPGPDDWEYVCKLLGDQ